MGLGLPETSHGDLPVISLARPFQIYSDRCVSLVGLDPIVVETLPSAFTFSYEGFIRRLETALFRQSPPGRSLSSARRSGPLKMRLPEGLD